MEKTSYCKGLAASAADLEGLNEALQNQPDESQDEDGAGFLWEALFDTLRKRFYIVFPFARQACDMSKPEKTKEKLWFLRIRSYVGLNARSHEKTSENEVLEPLQPFKIEPGAVQDAQKPAKSDNKRGKKRQECPRSTRERPSVQKSANIAPTWFQQT